MFTCNSLIFSGLLPTKGVTVLHSNAGKETTNNSYFVSYCIGYPDVCNRKCQDKN